MNNRKIKAGISTAFAILLLIGSGLLLNTTINDLYSTSAALTVVSLSLLAVFLYVGGASIISRNIKRHTHESYAGFSNGVLFALLLIGAGTLLLCFNTGIFTLVWKGFFFSWPMLLFVIGSIYIYKCHFTWGILLVATGTFFLHSEVSEIYPNILAHEQFFFTYWPIGIILAGLLILFSIIFRPKRVKRPLREKRKEEYAYSENEDQDGKINYQFIFSGTEQIILDPEFKGGNIEAIFGGVELDLRRTSLPEGETFLCVNVIFGGVEITAPDHWDIEIRSRSIAGGVCDSRVKNIDKDQTRKLILVAKCTFGGIEIK